MDKTTLASITAETVEETYKVTPTVKAIELQTAI